MDELTPFQTDIPDELRRAHKFAHNSRTGIQGWIPDAIGDAVVRIAQFQLRNDIHGGIGEIGVHHGRFFILLNLCRRNDEPALAVDLYEDQHLNRDGSGRGDRDIFLRNVSKYCPNSPDVTLLKADSSDLVGEDIVSAAGSKFRLLSIDGGHTAELTKNDMIIAANSLAEGGVVFLDDYFHGGWPEVSVGTVQFMEENRHLDLVPFAIVSEKFLFTTRSHHQAYIDALTDSMQANWRTMPYMGHTVAICAYVTRKSLLIKFVQNIKLSKLINRLPLGGYIRNWAMRKVRKF
jgi:hypothetical protein